MYDAELEGQMSMLFDGNRRLLKVSDIYPEEVQLAKGDYVIRAQLRHDDTGGGTLQGFSGAAACLSAPACASFKHVLYEASQQQESATR